jgi:hypothetical protein
MKTTLMLISLAALIVLLVGPVLHAISLASAEVGRNSILVGTIAWFATAPFWIRQR